MVRMSWGSEDCEGVGSCWSGLIRPVNVQPSNNDSGRSGRAREEPRLLRNVLREVQRYSATTGACAVSDEASVSDLPKRRSLRRDRVCSVFLLVLRDGWLTVGQRFPSQMNCPMLINCVERRRQLG